MYSTTPKVLHKIANKALLQHVIDAAQQLNPQKIIVIYGFGGEQVPQTIADPNIIWVEQKEQLGTGHAVLQALPYLDENAQTLILLGDVPLIAAETCQKLLSLQSPLALLTFDKANPSGYGRIVRNAQEVVTCIVEHKDASDEQRQINEVNTGIISAQNQYLQQWLPKISNQNAQKEFYLTDIVSLAVADGQQVQALKCDDEWQVTGINSKTDLAAVERVHQQRQVARLLQQGVTLLDPQRLDIRGELVCGKDVEIDVGCIFSGKVSLADGVRIGAYCVIENAQIAQDVQIAPFTHIVDAVVGASSKIGPYARLRPGTVLASDTHIGNFVELKNAQVDVGSKVNHLSYIGDASVGKNVNIGAGTITCNYDGANKFRTIIEDDAFIGSDSQLVAPVTVGKGATIAAGSCITQNAPAGELTLARSRQITINGWKRPVKIKK